MVCNWLQIGKIYKPCNYAAGTSRHTKLSVTIIFKSQTFLVTMSSYLFLFRSWCGERRCQGQGREWQRGLWGAKGARGPGARRPGAGGAGEDELRGPGVRGAGGDGHWGHHGGLQGADSQPGLQSPQVRQTTRVLKAHVYQVCSLSWDKNKHDYH